MSNDPISSASDSEITFSPRVATQDWLDVLLAALLGVLLAVALFGLPAIIVFLVTHSTLAAVATFVIVYLCFLAFSVWSLSGSDYGLRLHRLLGGPRVIPWSQITSIREVCRAEVIIQGWLWPLFPPREFTPCLSSVGHFRIDYDGGHIYYPPRDIEKFRSFVADRLPTAPSTQQP
jgi:hypothetical protein